MQAYSKLRRNCARRVRHALPGVCVAKSVAEVHAPYASSAASPATTLVLYGARSASSTDAINHDLIALPICCASRDLQRGDGINKKRHEETPTTKATSKLGKSKETPEQ